MRLSSHVCFFIKLSCSYCFDLSPWNHISGVGRRFIAGGLTIVGVSINFNAEGSGGILPQEISKF